MYSQDVTLLQSETVMNLGLDAAVSMACISLSSFVIADHGAGDPALRLFNSISFSLFWALI